MTDVRPPAWHRPLILVAAATAPFILVALAGVALDDRILGGAPIWLKPFKFAVSIVIYALTLAWLTTYLPRTRLVRSSATIIATMLAIEYVVIVGQVIRGRFSHFNVATPLDATLWGIMGTSITVLWVANLVRAVFVLRRRIGDPAVTWAVRAGTVIALFGMAIAFMMTRPTGAQRESLREGTFGGLIGGHTVEVADGGPINAVTGWSTVGGDLRIPHFVGIHALQVVPLLALALALLARRIPLLRDGSARVRLVFVAAAGYAGLTGLALWQALRGQPLIHPDRLTAVVFFTVVAAVLVAAVAVVTRPARAPVEHVLPGGR
ncbi:hypothetical protein [Amycolatopsis alkalitolerans]|uniref:Uncharacterized protein n=1 Tax=Amycolatopsis alkalitolerans TaxID=2547244 RepID=A0A5C4LQU9_9PSEU|nr:hypothetical protein [Amycolatopsis alkalitolerans]TNC21018.1 hypothetical protein FG385_29675 [Amycolatopsis alkalitolerans]